MKQRIIVKFLCVIVLMLVAGSQVIARTAKSNPASLDKQAVASKCNCESEKVQIPGLSVDIVANADTAVKVAEVILPTIYGDGVLGQRPFKASLSGGYWVVVGTLHGGPYMLGGVASIEIRKTDSKILSVSHGK